MAVAYTGFGNNIEPKLRFFEWWWTINVHPDKFDSKRNTFIAFIFFYIDCCCFLYLISCTFYTMLYNLSFTIQIHFSPGYMLHNLYNGDTEHRLLISHFLSIRLGIPIWLINKQKIRCFWYKYTIVSNWTMCIEMHHPHTYLFLLFHSLPLSRSAYRIITIKLSDGVFYCILS